MKLNLHDLSVTTFQTVSALPGTLDPEAPTPMTRCFDCPPQTIGTEPETVVVTS